MRFVGTVWHFRNPVNLHIGNPHGDVLSCQMSRGRELKSLARAMGNPVFPRSCDWCSCSPLLQQ